MPYAIERSGNNYNVIKESDGQIMGTHDTRQEALSQLAALEANEADKSTGSKMGYDWKYSQIEAGYVVKSTGADVCAGCRFFDAKGYEACKIVKCEPMPIVSGGYCNLYSPLSSIVEDSYEMPEMEIELDFDEIGMSSAMQAGAGGFKSISPTRWIGWFSNNFEDRDGEIFTAKAIERYVDNVSAGKLPYPELWYYHIKGTRFGVADGVFQLGHFVIATGIYDNNPVSHHLRKWLDNEPDNVTMSHGFLYNPANKAGRVYHDFATFEVSVLDKGYEANPYTAFNTVDEVIKMQVTDVQKQKLLERLPAKIANEIISGAEQAGKALRDEKVAYKSNDDGDFTLLLFAKLFEQLEAIKAAMPMDEETDENGKPPKKKKEDEDESEMDKSRDYLLAYGDQLDDIKASVDRLSQSLLDLTRRQPASSKADSTLIPDNDAHANAVQKRNYEQGRVGGKGLIQQIVEDGTLELTKAFPLDTDDIPAPPATE